MAEYKEGLGALNPNPLAKILHKSPHFDFPQGFFTQEDLPGAPGRCAEEFQHITDSLQRAARFSDTAFTAALFGLAIFLRTRSHPDPSDPSSPFFCADEGYSEEDMNEEQTSYDPEAPLACLCRFLAQYIPSGARSPADVAPLLDCLASLSLIWPRMSMDIPPAFLLRSCLLIGPPLETDSHTFGMASTTLETETTLPSSSEAQSDSALSPPGLSPPTIVLMPVNLSALQSNEVSMQLDQILPLLPADLPPLNLAQFVRDAVSIRYDYLLKQRRIAGLLRHCAAVGAGTGWVRFDAAPPVDGPNSIDVPLDSFQPYDFAVPLEVVFFAADLFQQPVDLDSLPPDAFSVRIDELSRVFGLSPEYGDLPPSSLDALSVRVDIISSTQSLLPMFVDFYSVPESVVSFPALPTPPPLGNEALPMEGISSLSEIGYSAIVTIVHEFVTPELLAEASIADADVLDKLLLYTRILPRTLRFPCDPDPERLQFWPSEHAVKIAAIVRRIALGPRFALDRASAHTLVLLLDALLRDVLSPSIVVDVSVLLQVILERNLEFKRVLADYQIIERLFVCLRQDRNVISKPLLSELSNLISHACNTPAEIEDLLRTSFWDVSCSFAPDIAARFLPIFTSVLNQTPFGQLLVDDCLNPEQFEQLRSRFMQGEVTLVGKLNWFGFLAELLPRASEWFLKHVTLSPSFLDEFSEILEVGGLPLIDGFLSLVEHLMSDDPLAVCDALAPSRLVPERLMDFLEVNSPDEQNQDILARAAALLADIGDFLNEETSIYDLFFSTP
jgi:hypothetical protein